MRAVDTNVLVRLVVDDDPEQLARAETFARPGIWVSLLVLMEAMWVARAGYGKTPKQIASSVEMLLSHARLTLQDADAVREALAVYRAHPSLGFSDCLVRAVALKAGHTPIGTFDRTLGKLPGMQKL